MGTPDARARRLRGALVGLAAAVTTGAAHASAGGGLPAGPAMVIVVLLCATIGAGAAAVRVAARLPRWIVVVAALAAAQGLGHLVLSVLGQHHHGAHAALPGLTMAASHAVAAMVLGGAIAACEYLYLVCASVLCWLRLTITCAPRPPVRVPRRTAEPAVASRIVGTGLGMRAPPRFAAA